MPTSGLIPGVSAPHRPVLSPVIASSTSQNPGGSYKLAATSARRLRSVNHANFDCTPFVAQTDVVPRSEARRSGRE